MDLIGSTGHHLRFWNLQTSDPLRTIASPCPQGITCMTTDKPNPRRLYLGTSHGGIAVMHIVTGQVGGSLLGLERDTPRGKAWVDKIDACTWRR